MPSSYRTSLRSRASRRSGPRAGRPTTPTRFDRTQPRENVYSIDTPPPTVSGSLHVGPRVLLHPHRPGRALPADARQGRVLPDGLGRQRPADRAPGAELLRRPLRPVAARTTPTSRRRRSRTRRGRSRSAGPTSSSSASSWSSRTRRSSRSCGARLGLSVDWKQHYTTIGPKAQTVSQRAFLRNFARGEAYLQEAPTLWDVTFQTAVAQAELEAREYAGALPPGRLPQARRQPGLRRDHPPRADPQRRRADRPPRRRALPAAVRHHRHLARSSASRSRCSPTPPPSRTRAPASRCAARSATSPTSPGGASSTCRSAR